MRYFDEELVANSRPHQNWWNEVEGVRLHFEANEENLNQYLVGNASAVLPRDAWLEIDEVTTRVMRDDEGEAYMRDLMALAKPISIGKLVHLTRTSSDAGSVVRSLSGQVPVPMDKTTYDYAGAPIPIFSAGYGREWREWQTLQSENFDALADDQENITAAIREDMANYALNGDSTIVINGYTGYGIKSSKSKTINLGAAVGGANIDLTTADPADVQDFFATAFGAMLDTNLITEKVNLYVSPEIARNLDRSLNPDIAFMAGSVRDQLLKNRRINKIETTYKLSGNQFFGFVPNQRFIRPLVGMAVNTTAIARRNPTDNYQFLTMGAMGLEIRADINGKSGVFYSTDID